MKRKSIALLLAMVMCLGLTIPTFAAGTETHTMDGITITASSDGIISFTGSGALEWNHAQAGLELFMAATNGQIKTAKINVGSNVTYDQNWLTELKDQYSRFDISVVISDSSAPAVQTVGGFTDVKPDDYFADPVVWAVNKKITAGTSKTTFSPNTNCTVAQILTFLYRAKGSPSTNAKNPFSDVKSSDYYYSAALWAYEKGMVTGSTFGGARPCTRSMAVTYMWQADRASSHIFGDFEIGDGYLVKYNGSSSDVVIPDIVTFIGIDWYPEPERLTSVTIPSSVTSIEMDAFFHCDNLTDVYYEGSEAQWKAIKIEEPVSNEALTKAAIHYNSKMPEPSVNTGFTDVPATADYAEAVKWAVDKGITSGTSAATFSPDSVCTRGQIVTFLYRGLAK